jgi:hypothetical protein
VTLEAFGARDRERRRRIETAGKQDHRLACHRRGV